MPKGYKARPEQVILFTVSAWDNRPQHIHQRFEAADAAARRARQTHRGAGNEVARLRADSGSGCRAKPLRSFAVISLMLGLYAGWLRQPIAQAAMSTLCRCGAGHE